MARGFKLYKKEGRRRRSVKIKVLRMGKHEDCKGMSQQNMGMG
jgi:hypothetical protein